LRGSIFSFPEQAIRNPLCNRGRDFLCNISTQRLWGYSHSLPASHCPRFGWILSASHPSTLPNAADLQSSHPRPCTFALTFIEDITIPDGTFVTPGEKLDKRWRVENSGSCNWDDTTRVKLLNGPALDAPLEQALYPARSGAQAIIRMTFTAPLEPGVYRSAWQAVDPTGNPFGEIFFVEIGVAAP